MGQGFIFYELNDKILIADDEESIVIGLTALLEEEGYDVSSVTDGQKAFDELKRQNYALLLADLKMPGLDGLQILNKILKYRQTGGRCDVRSRSYRRKTVQSPGR